MDHTWIDEFNSQRIDELYVFCTVQWWTGGRSLKDVRRMLEGSDILVGYCNSNEELVGFARVLTDFTFKAFIFDVIVREDHQGQGIGEKIIHRIFALEALKTVSSFELYCPDRIAPFYEKLGFKSGSSKLLFYKR